MKTIHRESLARIVLAAALAAIVVRPVAAPALQDAVNGVIPGPPTFYRWVLPLDYDGTSFTVPKTYGSCGSSWNASPYFAAKDGSLAMSGSIVLKPACASLADPKNVPSSADTPAFYIVAVPLSWVDGKPGARHFDAKSPNIPAIAIAGPVDPGAGSWSFKPLSPVLKMHAKYGYMFFVAQLTAI